MKEEIYDNKYLLTCVSEECSEVTKEACKGIRFGLDNHHPGKPATNGDCLMQEFYDLCAIIEMLQEQQALPKYDENKIKDLKEKKKFKIYKNYI